MTTTTTIPTRTYFPSEFGAYDPLAHYERPDGSRAFTNAKLQSAVDLALSKAKPKETFVAVAHHVYEQNGTEIENVTKVSLFVRLGKGLSLAAGGYKDWSKPKAYGAGAEITWRPGG